MPFYPVRKCLSLTQTAAGEDANSIVDSSPVGPQNAQYIVESQTAYLKFWVSWKDLMPQENTSAAAFYNYLDTNRTPQNQLAVLDSRIAKANSLGRGVILTVVSDFPEWSNRKTRSNSSYAAQRGSRTIYQAIPDSQATDSPFGWFINYICRRYASSQRVNPRGAYITALEVTNEPNLGFWPQQNVWSVVAQMMMTAEAYATLWGGPVLLGPATSDEGSDRMRENDGTSSVSTGWLVFTQKLLSTLKNFRPRVFFGWSHHNYRDVRNALSGGTPGVVTLRQQLYDYNWKGGGDRAIYLTEGGWDGFATGVSTSGERSVQRSLVYQNFTAMRNTEDVILWTQHHISDIPGQPFHSGLRDDGTVFQLGAPRELWFDWKNLSYFPGSAP